MRVKEAMSKKPEYLKPDASLKEAALEMERLDCGFVPIGDGDRLLGTVTDRDIAIRAVAKGKDPNKTSVKEIMSDKVYYIFEDDDLAKAAKSMEDMQIRRLIVLDKNKKMTGILSICDITRKSDDTHLVGEIIESVSEEVH